MGSRPFVRRTRASGLLTIVRAGQALLLHDGSVHTSTRRAWMLVFRAARARNKQHAIAAPHVRVCAHACGCLLRVPTLRSERSSCHTTCSREWFVTVVRAGQALLLHAGSVHTSTRPCMDARFFSCPHYKTNNMPLPRLMCESVHMPAASCCVFLPQGAREAAATRRVRGDVDQRPCEPVLLALLLRPSACVVAAPV